MISPHTASAGSCKPEKYYPASRQDLKFGHEHRVTGEDPSCVKHEGLRKRWDLGASCGTSL
eukprot:2692352-Amphidinium_carterae.1